jgi:lipopolysaccharide/colanic/teichoic acid biosynthesis glycosyltransferase
MNSRISLSSDFLPQESFVRMFHVEQKRTERSKRPFVLLLLESELLDESHPGGVRDRILAVLAQSTRETDIRGWYRQDAALGVIFTEIAVENRDSVALTISTKIGGVLSAELSPEELRQVDVSFYVFPEDWQRGGTGPTEISLHEHVAKIRNPRKIELLAKRGLDIAGSALALIVGAPIFLGLAIAVKATSEGPILFRQSRVGQYGKRFTFLKFRSMYAANDPTIHEKFIKSMIAGSEKDVYKITNDPRITPLGRWLRKTSLDELPQFLNVLMGEMSLVGPRPPIPYEVEAYDIWHCRRLLDVKPGITGLWQVAGRSKTKFDDMVRLDLQYARTWTLWMDVKILLRTPRAVVMGDGAY